MSEIKRLKTKEAVADVLKMVHEDMMYFLGSDELDAANAVRKAIQYLEASE